MTVSDKVFLKLFVEATDLPAGMSMPQDSRTRGADLDDVAYRQFGGSHAGLTRWHSDQGPINRLIDIRVALPNAQAARDYAHTVLRDQMENMPKITDAAQVGSNCVVVGGSFISPLFPNDSGHTSICYLFTVGPVWVKLFAADYSNSQMTMSLVHNISQKIVQRIEAALPDRAVQEAKPWWRRVFG